MLRQFSCKFDLFFLSATRKQHTILETLPARNCPALIASPFGHRCTPCQVNSAALLRRSNSKAKDNCLWAEPSSGQKLLAKKHTLIAVSHCPFFSLFHSITVLSVFIYLHLSFPSPSFSFLLIPDFQHFVISIVKARALGVGCSVSSATAGSHGREIPCKRTPPWKPSFQFCLQFAFEAIGALSANLQMGCSG